MLVLCGFTLWCVEWFLLVFWMLWLLDMLLTLFVFVLGCVMICLVSLIAG